MDDIKQLVEDGFAVKRIATLLSISEDEIKQEIKANNLAILKDTFDPSKIDKIIDKIMDLYARGVSAKQLATKFSIDKRRIQQWADERGIKRDANNAHRFIHFDDHYFDVIDANNKAYWLGFIFAKSYNDRNVLTISIKKEYKQHLEKFAKEIGLDAKYIDTQTTLHSNHLCKTLNDYGVAKNKKDRIYPISLLEKYKVSFVLGYSDGCAEISNNRIDGWKLTISGTDSILQEIYSFISAYCFANIQNDKLIISNDNIHKILTILYGGYDGFIENKYEKYFSKNGYDKNISIVDNNDTRLYLQVMEINGQKLTKGYTKSLNIEQRSLLIDPIFQQFRSVGFVYPAYNSKVLKSQYKNIVDYKVDLSKTEVYNNTTTGVKVCKTFCGKSFFSSCEIDHRSILETWASDEKLKSVIKNRLGLGWHNPNDDTFDISYRTMMLGFRNSRIGSVVSIFKPTIAKYICMKYSEEGDLVGDYSCGFGGRLLGAMSCGRRYIGTDPLTVPELENMVAFYGFDGCKLIHSGSENYIGEENSIDLYWSSPPYFDKEIYSQDKSQAYNNSEEYFFGTYWMKTLLNVRFMLKPNKWFGLNIKNDKMLEMARKVFGNEDEFITLTTVKSNLNWRENQPITKAEYIYMFRNKK